jgi:hypothetical protein
MQITRTLLVLIGTALCAGPGSAQMIKIDAGDVDRIYSPACALIHLDKPMSGAVVTLRAQGAPDIEAQLQALPGGQYQLMWIEPKLTAKQSRTYELKTQKGEARPGFAFAPGAGYRDLRYAGKGVLRYMNKFDAADFDNTFKPFHQVFDFNSEDFITKGAGGSFTHHRGLFFGFNKTQYGDFWHCKDGVSQRFDHFIDDKQFAGPVAAREVSVVNWDDKDGKPVARDFRDVTAWHVSPTQLVLDWVITLEALRDDGLKLDGDPQHAGFHFRAAQEVAEGASGTSGGTAKYLRPASAKLTKNDEWLDTPWAACMFSIKGKPYTVIHLDHPDNPKPVTYSTRAYGRFGAFFKGNVEKGKPLTLKYRIIVMGGEARDEAALAHAYSDYALPPRVQAN